MILPLGVEQEPTSVDEYESEPIPTLQEAIALGLAVPYRAFCLYLRSRDEGIYRVILAFRADGSVVFGLSVDDPDNEEGALDEAKRLLLDMADAYGGVAGFVACEVPPPLLGETFPTANEGPVVCSWHRRAT